MKTLKHFNLLIEKIIPNAIQTFVVILMVGITMLSAVVSIRECMALFNVLFSANSQFENFSVSGLCFLHISNAILAVEFMLLSIKYFREHFHFPLRYVIYIGITSIIRHMVVSHEHLLLGSIAILLLVVAYCMICFKNDKLGKERYA